MGKNHQDHMLLFLSFEIGNCLFGFLSISQLGAKVPRPPNTPPLQNQNNINKPWENVEQVWKIKEILIRVTNVCCLG